jgi:hypothetical protein
MNFQKPGRATGVASTPQKMSAREKSKLAISKEGKVSVYDGKDAG